MTIATIIDGMRRAGETAAVAAAERLGDALVAAAAAELPGIAATRTVEGVELQGRGLRARAFGTIRRAADPRVAALTLLVKR